MGDAVAAEEVAAEGVTAEPAGFRVDLEVFSGPFDVLLDLIARRSLDITEIALAEVTDEFLAYVAALHRRGEALEELSQFLVVAATLLDLKTARLLPGGDTDEDLDLDLLEARDLLFVRLLQYRAYTAVSRVLGERMAAAGRAVPRAATLEEAFTGLLPPLEVTTSGESLARMFARVLAQDRTPPQVEVTHLHEAQVSVAEERARLLSSLREAGELTFAVLIAEAGSTAVVVARFLAVLELMRSGSVRARQDEALGPLLVALRAPEHSAEARAHD